MFSQAVTVNCCPDWLVLSATTQPKPLTLTIIHFWLSYQFQASYQASGKFPPRPMLRAQDTYCEVLRHEALLLLLFIHPQLFKVLCHCQQVKLEVTFSRYKKKGFRESNPWPPCQVAVLETHQLHTWLPSIWSKGGGVGGCLAQKEAFMPHIQLLRVRIPAFLGIFSEELIFPRNFLMLSS